LQNHEILLAKLRFYGIRGESEDWFRSYLTNRRQKFDLTSPTSAQIFTSKSAPLSVAPDVGERSVSRPKTLCSGRNPSSECKGAGMDTRAGLNFSLKRISLNATWNPNPRPFNPQREAILRRGLQWATLHTTRQGLHSQVRERAASELTTPVT